MTIFIVSADQDPEVPKPEDRKECPETDCPGEAGWAAGYGLAGGGIGVYMYCNKCGLIIDKVQDLIE